MIPQVLKLYEKIIFFISVNSFFNSNLEKNIGQMKCDVTKVLSHETFIAGNKKHLQNASP